MKEGGKNMRIFKEDVKKRKLNKYIYLIVEIFICGLSSDPLPRISKFDFGQI